MRPRVSGGTLMLASATALLCVLLTHTGAWASERATQALVAGNTQFALDLYGQVAKRDGNVALAPFVISAGLSMVEAGARGETQQEIARALHVGMPRDTLCVALRVLQDKILSLRRPGVTELELANGLWLQVGFPFLDSYKDLVTSCHRAELDQADFRGDLGAARGAIDAWVETKTRGLIPRICGSTGPDTTTVAVWVSAVYFKGRWRYSFEAAQTVSDTFFVRPNEPVVVSMMTQRWTFPYFEDESVQAVELPYKDSSASMVLVLPRDGSALSTTEAALANGAVRRWLDGLDTQDVVLTIPRFTVSSWLDLQQDLGALGIRRAFLSELADLSGISESMLYLTAAVHRTVVRVTEEGTEAAGAFRLDAAPGLPSAHPPVFRADHPFLFLIRDRASGSVLFMGRVANPSAEESGGAQSN